MTFSDKIVFITGASSGIGEACAHQFAALGAKLVLSARRVERLDALAEQLMKQYQCKSHILQLDVRDRQAVLEGLNSLPKAWQDIDLLINNAGLALSTDRIQDSDMDNWETMIDTNIKGLLYVSRQVLPGMIKRGQGHVVNICSIAGHECYPAGNVYSATKHAVKAISKSMRLDLLGTGIRVTDISPGAVETEFSLVRWNDEERARNYYKDFEPLIAQDIADAIVYCTSRPLRVNIEEMVIMPRDQASANHFHRK